MDFPSFFFAGDNNDPRVNSALRQRIALSLLSAKKGYPRNIGEGLTAIGDAIGDIGTMRKLAQFDLAQQDQARAELGVPSPPEAPAAGGRAPLALAEAADGADNAGLSVSRPPAPSYGAPPQLVTAASQPSSMLSPSVPTGLTAPQATLADLRSAPGGGQGQPSAGPEDGGYNMIDAQAGMKRTTPGYMQDAITRNVSDPDMQAYLGSLAAGEAKGPGDVSKTGAAGPFQFVPGTAKEYGLNDPTNLDASVNAAARLTADNAATFQRINGRPPTMAELAVMHQQGGTTGARMVAGTGNASPRNLSLNNVNPAASPSQAVSAIKGYYGMPDRAVDPRAGIAAALTRPRVMAFDDTPDATFRAQNFLPGPGTSAQAPIPAAPPQTSPYPQAGADFVTPMPGPVPQVAPEPMTPREAQLQRMIVNNPGNPYVATMAAPELKQLQEERALRQSQQLKEYESNLGIRNKLIENRSNQLATQTERMNADVTARMNQGKAALEINKMQDEASWRQRFGPVPVEKVEARLDAGAKSATSARAALIAADNIRQSLANGAITGQNADQKLLLSKIVTGLGLADKSDVIANTETLRSYIAPIISSILKSTVGTTQVSDSDRRFAENAAGGNINLDQKTISRLMDFIGQNSRYTMEQHQRQLNAAFPAGSAGRDYGVAAYDVPIPTAKSSGPMLDRTTKAQDDIAADWALKHPNDPRALQIWKAQGYKNAPKS